MQEILDKSTGAILFKRTEGDKKVDKLEAELAELKKTVAGFMSKQTPKK